MVGLIIISKISVLYLELSDPNYQEFGTTSLRSVASRSILPVSQKPQIASQRDLITFLIPLVVLRLEEAYRALQSL